MKELEHVGADIPNLPSASQGSGTSTPTPEEGATIKIAIVEDEIDVILSHQSGLIERKKHPQLYVYITIPLV